MGKFDIELAAYEIAMFGFSVRVLAASLIFPLLMPTVKAADDGPWSKMPYRRADGWTWESRTGMWLNPRPVIDPQTKQLSYERQLPSLTSCCDRTGLSFPYGSVNEDEFARVESPKKKRNRKNTKEITSDPSRYQDPNSIEAQSDLIQSSNMSKADKERLIAALKARTTGGDIDKLGPPPDSDPAYAGNNAGNRAPPGVGGYGYVEGERPISAPLSAQTYPSSDDDVLGNYLRSDNGRGARNDGTLLPAGRYEQPAASSSEESGFGSLLSSAGDALVGVAGVAAAVAPSVVGAAATLNRQGGSSSSGYAAPVQAARPAQAVRPVQYPRTPQPNASDISGTR